MVFKVSVEELKRPAQSLDLNPFEYLWDELGSQLHPGILAQYQYPKLSNALMAEWGKYSHVQTRANPSHKIGDYNLTQEQIRAAMV